MVELSSALDTLGRFPRLGGSSRGAVFGASLESRAINSRNWTTGGWVAWLRRYSMGAIDITFDRVFATPAVTSTTLIANHLDNLVAAKPAWCFVDIWCNDFKTVPVTAFSVAQANAISAVDAMLAAGIFPILVPVRATSAPGAWGAAAQKVAFFNNWLRLYAAQRPGVGYWDPNPEMIDFTTGSVLAALISSDDGIHDTTQGAMLKGKSAWNYLKSFIAAKDTRIVLPYDYFDATDNPTGDLLYAKGMFNGATDGVLNSATGNAGNGWTVQGNGGVTTACSLIDYTGFTGLKKQRVNISGTGGAQTVNLFLPITKGAGGFATGDVLQAEVELTATVASGSYWNTSLSLVSQDGSSYMAADGADTSMGDTGGAAHTILYRTEPTPAPSAFTLIYFSCQMVVPAGGAFNATFDWSRASLRKVI